jgi:hypothetical protein
MFRPRLRTVVLFTVSTLVVTLPVTVRPALAGSSAGVPIVMSAAPSDPTDRLRSLVLRFAQHDPRWEVHTAAWTAWLSSEPTAVTDFLSPGGGLEQARSQAAENATRNDEVISATIEATTEETSPIVHMTAVRASLGTLAEKEAYVRTGLKQAQELDALNSPVERAKRQAQQDRDYVADIAAHGSGAWVQAAAKRATQKGTDNDIAEFFQYGWASASDCDLQAYKMKLLEQDVTYRHSLNDLILATRKAQQAYEQASEAAKAKAAEDARAAWSTAAHTAAATQASWLANQQLAAAQAQSWAAVHAFAVNASTQQDRPGIAKQDWPGIATRAAGTGGAWTDEMAWAQSQAQEWTALYKLAKASVEALPTPTLASAPTS